MKKLLILGISLIFTSNIASSNYNNWILEGNKNGDLYIFHISAETLKKTPSYNPFVNNRLPFNIKEISKIAENELPKFNADKDEFRIDGFCLVRNLSFTYLKDKWFYQIVFIHKKYFLRKRCLNFYFDGNLAKYTKEKGENINPPEAFMRQKQQFAPKWNRSNRGLVSGGEILFKLSEKDFIDEPIWNPAEEKIPLVIKKASQIAKQELVKYTKLPNDFILEKINIRSSQSKGKWYYIFHFVSSLKNSKEYLDIPVLFSGKAIEGIVEPKE